VLQGYNGTVLAYGQTGTGKTHTLANIGLEDKSARGMMVRAVEDLFEKAAADTEYNTTIKLSYVQVRSASPSLFRSAFLRRLHPHVQDEGRVGHVCLRYFGLTLHCKSRV
jgi:AAA+ superfamily predicted ATPase